MTTAALLAIAWLSGTLALILGAILMRRRGRIDRLRYLEHYLFGVNARFADLPRHDVEDFGTAALDGWETADRKLIASCIRAHKLGQEDAAKSFGQQAVVEAERFLGGQS